MLALELKNPGAAKADIRGGAGAGGPCARPLRPGGGRAAHQRRRRAAGAQRVPPVRPHGPHRPKGAHPAIMALVGSARTHTVEEERHLTGPASVYRPRYAVGHSLSRLPPQTVYRPQQSSRERGPTSRHHVSDVPGALRWRFHNKPGGLQR